MATRYSFSFWQAFYGSGISISHPHNVPLTTRRIKPSMPDYDYYSPKMVSETSPDHTRSKNHHFINISPITKIYSHYSMAFNWTPTDLTDSWLIAFSLSQHTVSSDQHQQRVVYDNLHSVVYIEGDLSQFKTKCSRPSLYNLPGSTVMVYWTRWPRWFSSYPLDGDGVKASDLWSDGRLFVFWSIIRCAM